MNVSWISLLQNLTLKKNELHLYFGEISFSKSFHSKPEKRPNDLGLNLLVISFDQWQNKAMQSQ